MWENLWGIGGVWERRGSRGENERGVGCGRIYGEREAYGIGKGMG